VEKVYDINDDYVSGANLKYYAKVDGEYPVLPLEGDIDLNII